MNKAKLKSYAPQARKDFIAAVTARSHLLGLDDQHGQLKVAPSQTQGDVTLIAGQAWPAKVDGQRQQLIARMQREGFEQTVEAVAYTWFNRFAALRYMELHDYLGHGHRALSSREGGLPEILAHASELAQAADLPGLKAGQVNELKLAGNRDGELYRLLLIAQCNALHQAMPFLFERIDDETELLLPDNLLLSDSVIAKLVAEIPEDDWAEVEIIGWLYQFYISEKKDQVIGKVVKSEDIPAATQLFTPNWIVQYLVQNSVGRLWLMANPSSTLASQWPYYIQPAEQTPEVQAQLDALIQTRIREDGETLNPETITVLDPACGSGHILVVAYDVLKAIYLERGYQPRTIPRLILEKNLYGLDIDDRAAQLAGFALLMKARADDRRLFSDPPKLNVLSLQSSAGLNYEELCTHLAPFGVQRHTIWGLIETFEQAKTFGSLIQIPYQLTTQLEPLAQVLTMVLEQGDLYAQQAAREIQGLVRQAHVLAHQFDAVAANPPFMGSKGMNSTLGPWLKNNYSDSKTDLMTCFMERCQELVKTGGVWSMINLHAWMFLKSYQALREKLIKSSAFESLVHVGRGLFGSDFGSVAFSMRNVSCAGQYAGRYRRLYKRNVEVTHADELRRRFLEDDVGAFSVIQGDFSKINGSPIAYWLSKKIIDLIGDSPSMDSLAEARQGLSTSDNDQFLRFYWEVSQQRICFDSASDADALSSGARWFPHNKGGPFRKWSGNYELIVDWESGGSRIKSEVIRKYPYLKGNPNFVVHDDGYYFRACISWSEIGLEHPVVRWYPPGFVFNIKGMSAFPREESDAKLIMALCNSCIVKEVSSAINPTMSFGVGNFKSLPGSIVRDPRLERNVSWLIEAAKNDWDEFETSWGFRGSPVVRLAQASGFLRESCAKHVEHWAGVVVEMRRLEVENNQIHIDAYGLQGDLSSDVPLEEVTLFHNPRFRYGGEKSSQELNALFISDILRELLSYIIGCTFGRYSLLEPGLIYAHAGNVGFDPSRYEKKFPADADGIVPLTDEPWFTDDAASRVRDFLRAVWGPDTLEENMAWLAESLGVKGSETPDETIRRYLADKFFKDHLQTYKKRPIYWLFSSGKQGAFQALVYLHRYHEGTLARLRAEYVVPLTGKMQARLDMLQKDAQAATSTAARNKISKEIEKLKKKHLELLAYDEKLRHYADMRITLDLDDGVKVNYGKFGDLLAEVKAVTGGANDD